MNKNLFLRLCLMMCVLFTLWQCSSEDLSLAENNPKRNNSEFFKHSNSGDIAGRGGADYVRILENYNEEHNFLAMMPDKDGMPIWEKMKVVDAKDATGLMIPLSNDNETLSSLLFVIIDSENKVKGTNNITNGLLEDIIYNPNYPKSLRENLMNSFVTMDYEVFGNEVFGNIPKDLYAGYKNDETNRLLYGGNRGDYTGTLSVDENGKMMVINVTTCTTVYHCTHHGGGGCDHCSKCETTTCTSSMILIFTDNGTDFPTGYDMPPGGGGGIGIGSGEAPTGPGPQPPKDPCTSGKVFYRLMPGCGGGNVDPLPFSTHDPCEKIKSNFANTKFKEKVTALDKSEVFDYDHEEGYAAGYPTTSTGAIGTQYQHMTNVAGSHTVDLPSGDQYFGFMHTHNNESNGGVPIKIFSPDDLAVFLTSCVVNADQSGNIADAYAMVITSEGNYILNYTGFSSSLGIGVNIIKFWGTWYKREMKAIQNTDGSYDQGKIEKVFVRFLKEKVKIDGVELYKVEKITGKASELTLDANNNVLPVPCP